jgi:hypothetical protein
MRVNGRNQKYVDYLVGKIQDRNHLVELEVNARIIDLRSKLGLWGRNENPGSFEVENFLTV